MVALRSIVFVCSAVAACVPASAQTDAGGAAGTTAFCLLQVPADDPARQRWINLAVVQYVEISGSELRIVYGGGNFGAGFELRLAYGSSGEAAQQVERMRQTAAACAARGR